VIAEALKHVRAVIIEERRVHQIYKAYADLMPRHQSWLLTHPGRIRN
jgi:hypothetical protein